MGGFGVLGAGELYELDLLELVLTDEAANVFAVGAGLGPEAGGEGAEGDGEVGLVEDLVAEDVGDGDFGGGDEPVVVVFVSAGVRACLDRRQWKRSSPNFGKLAGAK